ncbi:MAG: transcriptional repressor [Lachnospiraceae bacterium]|jgi:Fur family peroxide stress response transcriptional regulator|nr:transcriptional repressor [Lachnospiraceae bacterium]
MAARKFSKQREAIKEFLMTRKDHPTADVIYRNVRSQNPNISLGTVYRNLTLLAGEGEINRLNVGDGIDHFDADTSPHYHFVCMECGSVIDLEMDSIESITSAAAANFEGQIIGHRTYFYGMCGKCIKSRS